MRLDINKLAELGYEVEVSDNYIEFQPINPSLKLMDTVRDFVTHLRDTKDMTDMQSDEMMETIIEKIFAIDLVKAIR